MAITYKALHFILVALALGSTTAAELQVISRPFKPAPHAFGDSAEILLNADGRWAAFSSTANGLVTNDQNGLRVDAFLRDLATGETTLLSRTPGGESADGDSLVSGLSADGRLVVFESDAGDLVANDTNGMSDVFLFDRDAGKASLVSGALEGEAGAAQITRNGRFVLFESAVDGLSPRDTNSAPDLYLFDRESGQTSLVSANWANTAAGNAEFAPLALGQFEGTLSEDGRYIAFLSYATDLIKPGFATTTEPQVYLRDTLAGTNYWISRSTTGGIGHDVSHPALSRDGSRLAFLSSRLLSTPVVKWLHIYDTDTRTLSEVPRPVGGPSSSTTIGEFALSADGKSVAYELSGQIYLYDIDLENSRLVSASSSGAAGSDVSQAPVISDDGKIVLFASVATNIVSLQKTDYSQLYRFDATSGSVTLLTPNLTGSGGARRDILFPVISGDGSKAGFLSYASDLVTNDDKFVNDVFIVGTSGNDPVQLVSVPDSSAISSTGDGPSDLNSAISRDGSLVVFSSVADDLVPNDTNNVGDVFLRDLRNGTTRLASVAPDGSQFPTASKYLSMSADGRRVAFVALNPSLGGTSESIYVYALDTDKSSLASILPNGDAAASTEGSLSADGRYLGFNATASLDLCVRDLDTGETVAAAHSRTTAFFGVSPGGKYLAYFASTFSGLQLVNWREANTVQIEANNPGTLQMSDDDSALLFYPRFNAAPGGNLAIFSLAQNRSNLIATNASFGAISGDGSTVVYQQRRDNTLYHLFVYDVASGTPAEIAFPGTPADFRLRQEPRLTLDGRYIAFTGSGNVIGGEVNAFSNVYLYDRPAGKLTLVNENLAGMYSELGSGDPSVTANGAVAFQSNASDLVANDRNLASDVFLFVPGPEDLRIEGVTLQGDGSYALALNFKSDERYQVQFRNSLASGVWQNIGAPVSIGSAPFTFKPENQSGFYRVQLVDPAQ